MWLVDPRSEVGATAAPAVDGWHVLRLADVEDELHLTIVAMPNALHAPVAHDALGRGAHVLIDKPSTRRATLRDGSRSSAAHPRGCLRCKRGSQNPSRSRRLIRWRPMKPPAPQTNARFMKRALRP